MADRTTAALAPRRRAPRLPAGERRAQILDAAIDLFARTGFRDASTAALAARLGLSEPALYRHFPSKRALYIAALDRSASVLLGEWRTIASAAASPLDALLEVGRWYFDQLAREPGHLLLRFRSFAHPDDEAIAARVRHHFMEAFHFVHGLHESARSRGQIAPTADTRAHTWVFMAVGALLDATEIMGLRGELRLEDMPAIMALAWPRPDTASGAPRGRRKVHSR
jgi:AcrR family transcriptional regulator